MSYESVFSDVFFYRVCDPKRHDSGVDVWGRTYAGAEAHTLVSLRERILTHKNALTLVKNCDNLLVMIGRKGEHPERLPQEFQDELDKYSYCKIGIVLASKLGNVCYIEYVETFLRGYDFAASLMSEVSSILECKVFIPLDISNEESRLYWRKYFTRRFPTYDKLVKWMGKNGVDTKLLIGYDEEIVKNKRNKK
jgi:hypothetical protein